MTIKAILERYPDGQIFKVYTWYIITTVGRRGRTLALPLVSFRRKLFRMQMMLGPRW